MTTFFSTGVTGSCFLRCSFLFSTFLRKWLPLPLPFCRYGAVNLSWRWDTCWSEDGEFRAEADDGVIGEMVLAVVVDIPVGWVRWGTTSAALPATWWHVVMTLRRCLDAANTIFQFHHCGSNFIYSSGYLQTQRGFIGFGKAACSFRANLTIALCFNIHQVYINNMRRGKYLNIDSNKPQNNTTCSPTKQTASWSVNSILGASTISGLLMVAIRWSILSLSTSQWSAKRFCTKIAN